MPLGITYFKRYRMEIDLDRSVVAPLPPSGFRYIPWDPRWLVAHAEAKYHSFRHEIDANVFACLGDYDGCLRLMGEISRKDGFLPEATWLVAYDGPRNDGQVGPIFCGTVQGIRDRTGFGAIQNLGVTPEFRGHGLGSSLLLKALEGFYRAGLQRAFLEVTAQNDGAIRLYRRLGFHKARTVYKAVEQPALALR
jgi:ribosomal protein S18 acetylase RimI-like enzyme